MCLQPKKLCPYSGGLNRLADLLILKPVDSLSKEEETELGVMLQKKQELLALEESKWCLKSKAVWLQEGDTTQKKITLMQIIGIIWIQLLKSKIVRVSWYPLLKRLPELGLDYFQVFL
jgi:hypothetical protein